MKTRLGARAAGTTTLLCVLLACSDTTLATRDAGAGDARTKALHVDAAVRVKPRTVAIELPPIAWQSYGLAADGSFDYGTIEPIDGAETCVVKRREAFATFQPFSPLEPPICVTTAAGEVARLEGIPANSDLVITIAKEGFVPATATHRVEELDVPLPTWATVALYYLLAKPGQDDPWHDSPMPQAGDASPATALVTNVWSGPMTAPVSGTRVLSLVSVLPGVAAAAEAHMTIERVANASDVPIELSTTGDRPDFIELSEGLYRVHVSHPRAGGCVPIGSYNALFIYGLPSDEPATFEMPVLAGHLAHIAAYCWCVPPGPNQSLVDLASCTFEPSAPGP